MSGELAEKYTKDLEKFMMVVAEKLHCLPSFGDPSPDGDNVHIIRHLDELIEKANKVK